MQIKNAEEEEINVVVAFFVPVFLIPATAFSFYGIISSQAVGEHILPWIFWSTLVIVNSIAGYYFWAQKLLINSETNEVLFIKPKAWLGGLVIALQLSVGAISVYGQTVYSTRVGADVILLLISFFTIGFLQSLVRSISKRYRDVSEGTSRFKTLKYLPYSSLVLTIIIFLILGAILNLRIFNHVWLTTSGGWTPGVPHLPVIFLLLAISVFRFQPEITKIMLLDILIFTAVVIGMIFLLYSGVLNLALFGNLPVTRIQLVKIMLAGFFGSAFFLKSVSLVRRKI